MTDTTQDTDVMRELQSHAKNVIEEAQKPDVEPTKTGSQRILDYLRRPSAAPQTCAEIAESTEVGISSVSSFLSQACANRVARGNKEGMFAIEQSNGPRLYGWGTTEEMIGKYGNRVVTEFKRKSRQRVKPEAKPEPKPSLIREATIQEAIQEAVEKYIDEMVEAGELQRVTEPLLTVEIFAHACEVSHDDMASLIASLGAA